MFLMYRSTLSMVTIALLALAAGCAGSRMDVQHVPQPAVEVERPDRSPTPSGIHHLVLPGQTMWRIARTYGLSVDRLAAANRIERPEQLSAGTRLFVPGARQPLDVPLVPGVATAEVPAEIVARVKWTWPVPYGGVVSRFGEVRGNRLHEGVDIDGRRGEPVLAISSGVVVYSGSGMRGYGKTVIVDHGEGLSSLYAHNSALLVGEGDRVRSGQRIARVGDTGKTTGEHCHLEIRHNQIPVDPLRYVAPGKH